jgi:hypothetical protein
MNDHDPWCKWPKGEPCRRFSTDGTRLGADIAHTMGTMDEQEIVRRGQTEFAGSTGSQLTGMPLEQADWESDEEE